MAALAGFCRARARLGQPDVADPAGVRIGEATGSAVRLISSLTVFGGFAVIERGELAATDIGDLDLDAQIVRRRQSGTAP